MLLRSPGQCQICRSVRILRCLITSACFAVLCAFALSIGSYSFNTQRKGANDRKAREGLTGSYDFRLTGHVAITIISIFDISLRGENEDAYN